MTVEVKFPSALTRALPTDCAGCGGNKGAPLAGLVSIWREQADVGIEIALCEECGRDAANAIGFMCVRDGGWSKIEPRKRKDKVPTKEVSAPPKQYAIRVPGVSTAVTFPAAEEAHLKALAKRRGLSVSKLIEISIKEVYAPIDTADVAVLQELIARTVIRLGGHAASRKQTKLPLRKSVR